MSAAVTHHQSDSAASRHILLAEDDLNTRLVLSNAIRTAGYRVTAAEDGRQASLQIRELISTQRSLDLLVLDVCMPGLNGIQLIELLKSTHIRLPIIVITGYTHTDMVDRLKRNGCAHILHKPFKPSQLLAIIGEHFDGADEESDVHATTAE